MENAKQNGILTGLLCFLSLIVSVITLSVCLGLRASLPYGAETESSSIAASVTKEKEEEDPLYVIGLLDGKITVYDSSGRVIRTLDKNPVFLPDEERKRLEEGISVFSPEEYYLVAENYTE